MRMFYFSRNETSKGTCAEVDLLKMSLPLRGRASNRGINPSARALTRLIPLETKHTHLLTYNSSFIRSYLLGLQRLRDTNNSLSSHINIR